MAAIEAHLLIIRPGKCLEICVATILGWRTKEGSAPFLEYWGGGGGVGGYSPPSPPPPPPPPPPGSYAYATYMHRRRKMLQIVGAEYRVACIARKFFEHTHITF